MTREQRKAIFPTAEDFTRTAEGYFRQADENDRLYGEAGLCLELSRFDPKGRVVTLETLRKWYDGEECPWLREAVQMAYLRIREQIESDPRYRGSGMGTRVNKLLDQPRLGGGQEEGGIRIAFGKNMDETDFE